MIAKEKPLISIALCTYNGDKYLKQQLDSLISQTYRPIEVVVTDDASQDGTLEILNQYATKYNFFKVYRNEKNLGFTKNFEKAISLCSGDLIALCDQDDIWLPEKLSVLQDQIADNDLIYHDSCFIDENDKPIKYKKMSEHYGVYDGESNLPFVIGNCVPGHTMLFKKTLMKGVFPLKEGFYHDWWIVFIAATIGKIKAVPNVLVMYRQHGHSVTDTLSLKSPRKEIIANDDLYFELPWIEHCLTFPRLKNKREIEKIYKQLCAYRKGERGIKLFFFMLKYYYLLFYFSSNRKKPLLSRLNKIRKISFYKSINSKHEN